MENLFPLVSNVPLVISITLLYFVRTYVIENKGLVIEGGYKMLSLGAMGSVYVGMKLPLTKIPFKYSLG